jgi:hypothetical protein
VETIRAMMDTSTYMHAQRCVLEGFADAIMDEVFEKNAFNSISRVKKVRALTASLARMHEAQAGDVVDPKAVMEKNKRTVIRKRADALMCAHGLIIKIKEEQDE